jgi:hypothetical protein
MLSTAAEVNAARFMRANGIGYQIDKCSRQLVALRVVPCRKFERKHALESFRAAFAWSSVST